MNASQRVLALVPAHNEEQSVSDVIREIRSTDPQIDILVVNDASSDSTSYVARTMGVLVADLPINLGIGGAVQTGFKIAQELGYEYVIQIDADGQHDPRNISDVLSPLLEDRADVSIGSRHLGNGDSTGTLTRSAGIRFFSWLTSRIISQTVTDCTSGFRALNKRAVRFFAQEYPVDFPDAEALISAHRAGLRIQETPATFRARGHGKSSLRSWRMLYYPCKETLSIAMMLTKQADSVS